jgi:multidrug resistance efflux pump
LIGLVVILVGGVATYKIMTLGSGEKVRDQNDAAVVHSTHVLCNGVVDVEGRMRELAPTQPGEVVDVYVTEGQQVKQGDALIKVNDEPAQIAVSQAQAGLENAEAQLAQAQQGIEQLRLALEKQQSAIDAAQSKLAAARSQVQRLEGLKNIGQSNDNDLNAARETVKAYEADVKAQQTEYRRIQAMKPEEKIKEAQSGVDLAKGRLREQKFKLEQCTLRAPCDGTIVRINVAKGTLISPQFRPVPIQLIPNGPRLVRAELLTEFAQRVQPGMDAVVFDESNSNVHWDGKVARLSDAFLPKRPSQGNEMLSLNGGDTNLLECIIALNATSNPPRIGQRVRVAIGGKQ